MPNKTLMRAYVVAICLESRIRKKVKCLGGGYLYESSCKVVAIQPSNTTNYNLEFAFKM
jgi:hypothetical protein